MTVRVPDTVALVAIGEVTVKTLFFLPCFIILIESTEIPQEGDSQACRGCL
ncbi:hypothetical protein PRBEI_2001552800 [Prionailurus iriomotensis]